MGLSRYLLLAATLCCLAADRADAAQKQRCLTAEERNAVIAARKTVPLARAMRVARAKVAGEVVNVRLCRQDKGLVYVLTVLSRNGKVTEARVDAADGRWIDGG